MYHVYQHLFAVGPAIWESEPNGQSNRMDQFHRGLELRIKRRQRHPRQSDVQICSDSTPLRIDKVRNVPP